MADHPFDDVLRGAGLLPEPPPRPDPATMPVTTNGTASSYAAAALAAECATVAAAADGTRNDTVNRSAFNIGTLVGAGHLDRDDAAAALLAAARTIEHRGDHRFTAVEAARTIESGLDGGVQHPREVRPAGDVDDTTTFEFSAAPAAAPRTRGEALAARATATPVSAAAPSRRLRVTRANAVQPRRVRWLWEHRVVLGGLTLLAGREGLGKSTIAVDLAAQVTHGNLAGEHEGTPGTVIYVHTEDARDYTIVPRLIAAGADLNRVIFIDAVTEVDGDEIESPIVLPHDTESLIEVITEHDAVLVVLDAATSVIDHRLDGNQDRQMRQGLERIGKVGERTGAAVVGIVHFGKRDSGDTGKLILGSIAWSQVARSVIAVARDDDGDDLVISTTKNNLAPDASSLAAQIISCTVSTDEGDASVGRVKWIGETDRDARDLLGAGSGDDDGERTERETATGWLREYLTQTHRAPSADVKKAAHVAGFSDRTLQRARTSLRVEITDVGFPRVTYWSLPDGTDVGRVISRSSCANLAVISGTTGDTDPDQGEQGGNEG
jgi:RecA/RadA recombinase